MKSIATLFFTLLFVAPVYAAASMVPMNYSDYSYDSYDTYDTYPSYDSYDQYGTAPYGYDAGYYGGYIDYGPYTRSQGTAPIGYGTGYSPIAPLPPMTAARATAPQGYGYVPTILALPPMTPAYGTAPIGYTSSPTYYQQLPPMTPAYSMAAGVSAPAGYSYIPGRPAPVGWY